MKQLRFFSLLLTLICEIFGEEISLNGAAKSIIANSNSVRNIESEIATFSLRIDRPQNVSLKFANPRIVFLGGDSEDSRPPGKSETLFFELRVVTFGDDAIPQKQMILMAYIKLRLNGMSAFNAGRVIFKIAEDWNNLRPDKAEQIPLALLEQHGSMPNWLVEHYVNKGSFLDDQKNNTEILCLIDNDITWLFFSDNNEANCICGYDSKHKTLAGFHEVFEKIIAERNFFGKISKVSSRKLHEEILKQFHFLWLSPLEIPLVFDS